MLKESDNKIEIPGIEISNNGSARTVWTYAKQKDGYDVIHMINLLGIEVSNWRVFAKFPGTQVSKLVFSIFALSNSLT